MADDEPKVYTSFDGSSLTEAEVIKRAMTIASDLRLGYMASSGEYDDEIEISPEPDEQKNPWDEMGRFMIFSMTDGFDDGWVDFLDTPKEVLNKIRTMIGDEWGFCNLWDLCSQNWQQEIQVAFGIQLVLDEGIFQG